MPGRRLSQAEQDLLDFWTNPPAAFARPLLRQVRIEDGAALRGIQSLVVPIPYPFTAICGRNSVGKSTILGLSALSAKSPTGWRPYWGTTRPRRVFNTDFEYSFADFFHRGATDPSFDGLKVGWVTLVAGNEINLVQERRASRWAAIRDPGRQGARVSFPVREIDFIPISRILPAGDQAVLRNAFGRDAVPDVAPLTQASIDKLSYIMGRPYQAVETRFVRGLGLPACDAGVPYSGFHMGSGEGSVIVLLSRLERLPVGGMLVVEEIELGLHAEAQARLVKVLIEHCLAKRIQVVCTTHSEIILDRLPRVARVLLRKLGDEHEAMTDVSTRYCLYEMSGEALPELVIYTEDRFAGEIIGEALIGPMRSRVRIADIGSSATLARQAVSHLRSQMPMKALSAFDGDCDTGRVQGWIDSERGSRADLEPDFVILPADGLPPERWILRELAQPVYLQRFANELNCPIPVATAHLTAMSVELDSHDCGYTLSRRTGMDQREARLTIVRCIAKDHPGLEPVRSRVRQLLGVV